MFLVPGNENILWLRLPSTSNIDVTTLMTLYEVRRVGRNSIAKELAKLLDLTPRTALRKLQSLERLRRHKLSLTVGYSLRAIGLKGVIFFSRSETIRDKFIGRSHFLRSFFPLIPFGEGVALYVPSDTNIFPGLSNDITQFEYIERIRSRVDIRLYGIRSITDPEVATSPKGFTLLKNDLENHIMRFSNSSSTNALFISHRREPVKYDWIDLTIIKELEKDPLKRLEDISKAVNLPISKILKHVSKHVLLIIRGIRIKYLPVHVFFDANAMVKVTTRDEVLLLALAHSLTRNPLFPVFGIGKSWREGIVQITSPFSLIRKVLQNLVSICNEYGIDVETDNIWLFSKGGKRFTIPYIKWEEYIPRVKWNVELLNRLIARELREE